MRSYPQNLPKFNSVVLPTKKLERNEELYRQFKTLTSLGVTTRKAITMTSENNPGISESVVNGLVYSRNYPHSPRPKIQKEEAEKAEHSKKDVQIENNLR